LLSPSERSALAALKRLLTSSDPRHLEDLATLLCCFRELVIPLLGEAMRGDSVDVRLAAAWTLGRIDGSQADEILRRAATDPDEDPVVREFAERALTATPGELPNPRLLPA